MSAALPLRKQPMPPEDRRDVADRIDEVRGLVEATSMTVNALEQDRRTSAMQTLLTVIDDKLSLISATVWPAIDP